ncbi:MAG: alpha/beta fold hydrolase [Planctomycetaceae bacterium]
MTRRWRWIVMAWMGASSWTIAEEHLPSLPVQVTASGVRYGIWPEKPMQPAPTLFIFSGALEDTLKSEYFRQAGNVLAKQGYLCVSIDLPCHGQDVRAEEPDGLAGWRHRLEQGDDFVAHATSRFRQVLDELIALKLADPDRIAACGTSRGGYMAVQFAAADPRIKCVAAFAPVTELTALREFSKFPQQERTNSLSLKSRAGQLAGRAVWVIIGDRDDRVSTEEAIAFCRAVTAESLERKRPALVDLHVVSEPKGHTTPSGAAELAAAWIDRQLSPMP